MVKKQTKHPYAIKIQFEVNCSEILTGQTLSVADIYGEPKILGLEFGESFSFGWERKNTERIATEKPDNR